MDRASREQNCPTRQSIGEEDRAFASPIATQPTVDIKIERDLDGMEDKEHHTISDSSLLCSPSDIPPPDNVRAEPSLSTQRRESSISSRTSHHRPVCKHSTKRTEKRINELTADNSVRETQREPSRLPASISQDMPVYIDLPPPNPSINPSISKHSVSQCIVDLKRGSYRTVPMQLDTRWLKSRTQRPRIEDFWNPSFPQLVLDFSLSPNNALRCTGFLIRCSRPLV